MITRQLGLDGPQVGALGLGCNRMSMLSPRDDGESVTTIMAALDAGITLLNTADFYGSGHNEQIVARAIKGRRNQAFLSVKFGALFASSGAFLGLDGRPNSVKSFAAYSLQRLGVDVIDLYQPSRPDPAVPYEDTIGAVADLIKEGKVRYLGVSEVGVENLRRAHAVHPVTALEIEYSLACRFIEPEILPAARELGVGIVGYRVLADGLLSGAVTTEPTGRLVAPRLQGDNLVRNLSVMAGFQAMAIEMGVNPAQLAVAWLLTRGDDIVPLIGMSRHSRIAENLAILDVRLTAEDLVRLDGIFAPGAVRGDRYPAFVMKYAAH